MPESRPHPALSRKRAPRGTLDRVRVLLAATAIMAEEGMEAVTIRRIADELDVRPMALYTYFRSKDEVFAGIYTRLLAEIDLPTVDEGPDGIRAVVHAYYELLIEHPALARIHLAADHYGQGDFRISEKLHGFLCARGLDDRAATELVATLVRFTIGSALLRPLPNLSEGDPQAWRNSQRDTQVVSASDRSPSPAPGTALPHFTGDEFFEHGLDLILAGVPPRR
ncbi:TetR/AcrR family transcriptional regulator [Amycolatopsis panacis]|uniref:TetR/AcrR family transcriptional regulator n=1 Tax=Amycolatopsis panacis TaxID=2340917 RepID=UPI0011C34DE5|nr:TetR/AcrR family transcriptional regulator [Amycolatopsis panacis]